jgi:hypothetical protein
MRINRSIISNFNPDGDVTFGDGVTVTSLAGVGDRMVVANATGVLSTQTIPAGGGSVTSIGTTSPLTGGTITTTGTIGITQATTSTDGYLSSTDWNTFNNKVSSATLAGYLPLTGGTLSGDLTVGAAAAATNRQLIINGVASKAGRIKFQESGSDVWLIGNGAASENGNFEIYNASGAVSLSINKATNAATFSGTITSNDTYGLALGSIAGKRRIQYGSDIATSFSFLTDSNTYAGIYASTATFSSSVTANVIHSSNGNDADSGNFTGFFIGGSVTNNARTASIIKNTSGDYDLIIRSQNNTGVTTGSLIFQNGSTEQIRLNSSGNLGLGVTPSGWGSNFKALEYNGGVFYAANTDFGNAFMGSNAYFDGSNWRYKTTNGAAYYEIQQNKHFWNIADSGTAGNAISFTQAMTLTSGGNLLLGSTTDNGAKFQVTGAATFSSTIKTASPTGYTAKPYKLGEVLSGGTTATHTVAVEIDGVVYFLLATDSPP